MTHFINLADIEKLSDSELRSKLHQIFNTLAARRLTAQEIISLQSTLLTIQAELNKRVLKL